MAKSDKQPDALPATDETVTVPVALLEQMQARLNSLEHAERIRQEQGSARLILDPAYEAWKVEASRTAGERTQDIADRQFGTDAPRWRIHLDSTREDGKPGPRVSEHPTLVISGNSQLEAEARYLAVCGIKKHDYRLAAEPVAAAA